MTTSTAKRHRTVDRIQRDRLGRWLRGGGWAFIWLGGLTLGFVVHQLWITTWFAEQNQTALAEQRIEYFANAAVTEVFVEPDGTILEPGEEPPPPSDGFGSSDVGSLPATLTIEAPPVEHEAFALIRIPRIDRLSEGWNVVAGVSVSDLKNGAGHMPATPLPGQPGNSVISGHRTTYGAPFHELDTLESGDRIEVETAIGLHVYEVRSIEIVRPTDVWVTEPRDGAWLTLTTCHPKFSARERLVVFAELIAGPNLDAVRVLS
jgi:sortase A